MATDFSGVSALAQTALAFNISYLALARFQYRPEVRATFERAKEQLTSAAGDKQDQHDSLAATYLSGLEKGDTKAWGDAQAARRYYAWLFLTVADRRICMSLSAVAAAWILLHAYVSLFFLSAYSDPFFNAFWWTRAIILGILTLATACPVSFWIVSRHTLVRLTQKVEEYTRYTGQQQKQKALSQVQAVEDLEKLSK
jgi:hypothetical protein